jgi:type II secretory pathway pseudopilin PulG
VSVLAIVIIVIAVLLVGLMVGGLAASARRHREEESELRTTLLEADRALAQARAEDHGWERTALESAARGAFAERSPAHVRELLLVQVVDRPGIEEDQAVFRVVTDAGSEEIVLLRHGDGWTAAGG